MYDCIVVGVGAHGSAALAHLAKNGSKVLGLEQFRPVHNQGSQDYAGSVLLSIILIESHTSHLPQDRRTEEQESIDKPTMKIHDVSSP